MNGVRFISRQQRELTSRAKHLMAFLDERLLADGLHVVIRIAGRFGVAVGDGTFEVAHGETRFCVYYRKCAPENWRRQLLGAFSARCVPQRPGSWQSGIRVHW